MASRDIAFRAIESGSCQLSDPNRNVHCFEYRMFEFLGLVCLITDNFPVFPDRVREFYMRFEYRRRASVKTVHFRLDGQAYIWDPETFNDALGLPNNGIKFYSDTYDFGHYLVSEQFTGVDINDVIQTVVSEDSVDTCLDAQMVLFCQLKQNAKKIYKVIRSNITCRGQANEYDALLVIEALMIFWIIDCTPFDVGNIILNRMQNAMETPMAPLPFGMLLTKLFHFLDLTNNGASQTVPRAHVME